MTCKNRAMHYLYTEYSIYTQSRVRNIHTPYTMYGSVNVDQPIEIVRMHAWPLFDSIFEIEKR